MIRNDNAGIRFVATQDHVAARLATEYKAGAFQHGANLPARKVDRKPGPL
jgi:hypothetical protein